MPFILKFIYNDLSCDTYYGGKSYRYGGEKYAVLCSRNEARRYKTIAQAEKAFCKRVIDSDNCYCVGCHACVNAPDDYKVEMVDE